MNDHGTYHIRRLNRMYVVTTDKHRLTDKTIISHPLTWSAALQFRKELYNGEVKGNDPRLKQNRPEGATS